MTECKERFNSVGGQADIGRMEINIKRNALRPA